MTKKKNTRKTYVKREPRVILFPTGYDKIASNYNRHDREEDETQMTKMTQKRRTALERSVRKPEGLNMFDDKLDNVQ